MLNWVEVVVESKSEWKADCSTSNSEVEVVLGLDSWLVTTPLSRVGLHGSQLLVGTESSSSDRSDWADCSCRRYGVEMEADSRSCPFMSFFSISLLSLIYVIVYE